LAVSSDSIGRTNVESSRINANTMIFFRLL
jgi:hypothetical protein